MAFRPLIMNFRGSEGLGIKGYSRVPGSGQKRREFGFQPSASGALGPPLGLETKFYLAWRLLHFRRTGQVGRVQNMARMYCQGIVLIMGPIGTENLRLGTRVVPEHDVPNGYSFRDTYPTYICHVCICVGLYACMHARTDGRREGWLDDVCMWYICLIYAYSPTLRHYVDFHLAIINFVMFPCVGCVCPHGHIITKDV